MLPDPYWAVDMSNAFMPTVASQGKVFSATEAQLSACVVKCASTVTVAGGLAACTQACLA